MFVGGGIETLPGVETARAMGLSVIVSDKNPNSPCAKFADHFILADTYDIPATIQAVRVFCQEKSSIDGVICMATDVPLTVANVANELGIPGIPVSSAKLVSDKVLMKKCFEANRLPISWYSEINNFEDFINFIKEKGYPLVIKPVDSRGARGVLLITKNIDLKWAYKTSLSFSPSKRVMLEQFLSGPQVSTESLVIDRKVHTIGFSDRNYEYLNKYAPHIIENGGDLPSILPINDQEKIIKVVERTAEALDISNGIIKGDMVLFRDAAYVIEVAARLSGGYFCSHEIPINTGVEFVKLAIRLAMGETIEKSSLVKLKNQAVSQRYFFPEPGIVKDLEIPKWIKDHPRIKLLEVRVNIGDLIPVATHHPSRAGLVITTGENREQAIKLAQKVVKEIKIITQPYDKTRL